MITLKSNYIVNISGLIMVLLALFSCKEELSADDEIAQQMTGTVVSYRQESLGIWFNEETYHLTTTFRGVPVILSKEAAADDIVRAYVDPSLVDYYNETFGEHQEAIPDDAFRTSYDGAFSVKAGQKVASDSLYVELNNAMELESDKIYLVPVRLESQHGNKLTYSIIFFKMHVTIATLGAWMHGGSKFGNYKPSFNSGSLFFNYFVFRTNGVPVGPENIKIDVSLTNAYPDKDLQVQAELVYDDASIKAYGSFYVPFPEGTYSLSKDVVTIPKGELLSRDSLVIDLKDYGSMPLRTAQLLGVKLKKISEDGVPPIANDSCMAYIGIRVY